MKQIPELQALMKAVEEEFNGEVKTTTEFERLSDAIQYKVGDGLGASTLKRIWGYIPSLTTPRISTLDILAQFAGHKSFRSFCSTLHAEDSSGFIQDRTCLISTELGIGDRISIGWAPNRIVNLSYLGDDRFEVTESFNAKLHPGDIIEVTCFLQGWPLFVPGILRDGAITPPYIAGKAHGLTHIEKK